MTVRIAAIQHDIVWGEREANFVHLATQIAAAAAGGARLALLSETFSTGFVTTGPIGEVFNGPSAQFLIEQARYHRMWVAGSCAEFAEPKVQGYDKRPFNTFILAGPNGEVHRYRKLRPFTYGGEAKYFRAGQVDPQQIVIAGLRVTPFICYDLRFADLFWKQAEATDVYLVPANWPTPRREHWKALLIARAIENQAYVVGCNRVGEGGGLGYSGDSCIIDPLGQVLASASGSESILVADISAERVATVRKDLPFLADRPR